MNEIYGSYFLGVGIGCFITWLYYWDKNRKKKLEVVKNG